MRKSEYQKLKVMNELEKKDPQEEVKAAAETQDAVSAPEVCAELEVEECKVTESPAEAVSEMTDAVQPGEQPIAAGRSGPSPRTAAPGIAPPPGPGAPGCPRTARSSA